MKKKLSIKAFNALPKWRQRVRIAKDILQQIELNTFIIEASVYVNNLPYDMGHKSIRDNWGKVKCKVCAMGACLMSMIHFKNEAVFSDMSYNIERISEKPIKMLANIFDPAQLLLIEAAFEQTYKEDYDNLARMKLGANASKELIKKAVKYCNRYDNPEERMMLIMTNIIINKGVFIP